MSTTIWFTRCPVPTAFSVALHLGWFDEEFKGEGIQVQSLLQSDDRKVRESHFDHTLADSFRHGGNTPPLWAFSKGNDVRLVGLSWTEQPQLLLTLPESGIKTAADLKGRKLALPLRTRDSIDFQRANTLHFYQTALASAGLTLKDVELVDIPVDRGYIDESGKPSKEGSLWNAGQMKGFHREEIFSLLRGKVDVFASAGPRGLEFKSFLGAHAVYDLASETERLGWVSNSFPYTFTVNGGLLQRRPDLVARILARVVAAAEWAKYHHSEVVRITAYELGVAEEFAEQAFGPALSQQLDVNLSLENVEALELRKNFLVKNGFLPRDFDIHSFIDHDPIRNARRLLKERAAEKSKSKTNTRSESVLATA